MNKEELGKKKSRELMKLASSLGVKGAWRMRKDELIDRILDLKSGDDKNNRIQNAPIGTIVAFKAPGGRIRSAKIKLRSTANRRLMVCTEYDAEYNISYDDVIWVKSGKRWPKGVYNLLKGRAADGKQIS